MDEEQLNKFRQEIYEPFAKAWDIVGRLRAMDLDEQPTWDKYMESLKEFEIQYPDKLGTTLYRVLLDAGDYAKRIWDGKM